jgi:transcriptional regulator with XRE-family HTH domain
MELKEKLQMLRKEKHYSQEDLAELLNVSRQAVAKWESGQACPDIENLVGLSEIFKVTIDSMVKNSGECAKKIGVGGDRDTERMIDFLCEAKKKTYAGRGMEESRSSRPNSHDLIYQSPQYTYLDTYLGGEIFSGEEAVWSGDIPIWAMNYSGRVLDENFSGDFLKEALLLVPRESPYRGPALYQSGGYTYYCTVNGSFNWFQGREEIYYNTGKVFECCFHGGKIA